MNYDVFNGDADGICALVQLRLAEPKADSIRITGIKRDINLLRQVTPSAGDSITVLDVSLEKNRADLMRVLEAGAQVFYADHHASGEIPGHSNLEAHIDQSPNICTSLIVDRHLKGRYKPWAIVAAFGDNMHASAQREGAVLGLTAAELDQLQLLGESINYNGYGAGIEDLHFPPSDLYDSVVNYDSPFEFIASQDSEYQQLVDGYRSDMSQCKSLVPEFNNEHVAVYMLPDTVWSRRVSGVFGNQLANEYPDRAHAVVTLNKQGGYLVSVRAPLRNRVGADLFCSSFTSGGGRAGAAGINHLPVNELPTFISRFSDAYGRLG